MAQRTCVLLVVALNRDLLRHAPRLSALAAAGRTWTLQPPTPAVTCTVQATMLTGRPPAEHGIVANGWYNRELAEVQFWKQSNALVAGEKVWETARRRDPAVTCAKLFWWYNMYSSADVSITPRPIYKADGRKLPDVYTRPDGLRTELQSELGTFPLFQFWGPGASIRSSAWIADSALHVARRFAPTLSLVYLPHLDYALQKLGPEHPAVAGEVRAIDAVVGRLLDYNAAHDVRTLVVSEYGIEAVDQPVAINRALRAAGLLRVRVEEGLELLDAGASAAFAVADHQVAHVYVPDPARIAEVAELCRGLAGVDEVWTRPEQAAHGLGHARSGELVLVAAAGAWFSYGYWLDERCAPDFARTVDIHRKPGYDPLELFIDPRLTLPKLRIAAKLLGKRLGFRTLMNVIPLDERLVRGSHGRTALPAGLRPVVIADAGAGPALDAACPGDDLPAHAVRDAILSVMFGRP